VHQPRLPREVNGYFFYASNVKQKPNVSNLGSNHFNESEKVKVQMCKKSTTDPTKGLSNLEAFAKSKSRKVSSRAMIKK
jgi:hypothetical protein